MFETWNGFWGGEEKWGLWSNKCVKFSKTNTEFFKNFPEALRGM